ncbi:hypothetical protein RCJ22_14250 [Vibrio sp. FNV 38]|nr:hypothetical protein [Vibrio sp. FNV 38]
MGQDPHPSAHYAFHLDACFNHSVKGWVYKKSDPSAIVHVAFKQGDTTFCEVMANQSRTDLKKAKLPTDKCSFSVSPNLPQKTLKPTLADLYFDGIKVNVAPICFSMGYAHLVKSLRDDLQDTSTGSKTV